MWRLIIKALKNQHDLKKDIVPVNTEPDVCVADGCELGGAVVEMCGAGSGADCGEKVLPAGSAGQLLRSLWVWTVGPREREKIRNMLQKD